MAGELAISYPAGSTLYAVLLNGNGQIYNTVTPGFEVITPANWVSYDISMPESGGTGIYLGAMPVVSAGSYWYDVRLQAGASPAITDTSQGVGIIEWGGTTVVPRTEAESVVDLIWDENIETAHGTDATAGFLLRALGKDISNRVRNANLHDSLREIIAIIEHQRSEHTHQAIGNIFFVDPVNGDTHANGNRGGISDPYAGIQDCHDNAVTDSNLDLIILLAGAVSGPTTLTEATTISKRYLFIRGPGRDFIWTRSSSGDTITVTADGVELAGFQVSTAATGSGNGITVTGANFFKAKTLWFNGTRGDAIEMTDCDDCLILDCSLQGSGTSGSGHGIVSIAGSGQTSNYGRIENCHLDNVQGDGIRLDSSGGGSINAPQIRENSVQGCTGNGINIVDSGINDAVINYNWLGNNAGNNVDDNGTNTVVTNNEQWAKAGTTNDDLDDIAPPTAGAIADAVWDEATADHTTSGSTGEAVADKTLSTAGIAAIWDRLQNTITTSGSIGLLIRNALNLAAPQLAAVVAGSAISVYRGDRWSVSVTGAGDLTGRTRLYFTVKKKTSDTDNESLLQIEETEDLLRFNEAAPAAASNGSLTVDVEADGDFTIVVEAAETKNAPRGTYTWDLQMNDANGPITKSSGTFKVTDDITRAVA